MATFIDDQNEEIEVLTSIFPSEIEIISTRSESTFHSFKIALQPCQEDGDNHVKVALICEFPFSYPEILPILSIDPVKGLGKRQIDELLALATSKAEENLGMPSIYMVAEGIKEWLADNNVEGQDGSMYAEMLRRMQSKDVEAKKKEEKAAIIAAAESELKVRTEAVDLEEEERLRKRQAGTQVTVESFMAWKINFEEEMEAKALLNGLVETVNQSKLTGKQFFLTSNASAWEAGLEEAILAAAAAGTSSEVNQKNNHDGDSEDSDSDYLGEDDEEDDADYSDGDDSDYDEVEEEN